jgi:uncharacterized protein involved in exopolysaccharide biosynthesis
MTTLPQTTPMRLPRPAGGGQIAIPSAASTGGPLGQSAGMFQMTASDVWRVFRTNWWIIVLMMGAFGVAGFFVNRYLAKKYPKFEASGLVTIQLAEETFHTGDEIAVQPQSVQLEQKTQVRGLTQAALFLSVLRDSEKVRQTDWFKQFETVEQAKEDLMDDFSATPYPESRLIAVKMSDRSPKDARIIVEEIVGQYIRDQQQTAANRWSDKARELDDQLAAYDRESKKIKAELTDQSSKLGSDNIFMLYSALEGKRFELTRLTESASFAEKEMVMAANEKKALEDQLNAGEVPPEVETKIFESAALHDYQLQLDNLQTSIDSQPGSNSPQRQAMERRKQNIEQKINDTKESLRDAYINELRSKVNAKYDSFRGAYESAAKKAEDTSKLVREMMAASAA